MKRKTLSLTAGAVVLLFASSSIASTNPVISSSSENSVRISSARVVRALGGGSYVTGMAEPSFGYVAPHAAHVHVAAYDANGKLLAEKIDKINGNNLVRWHLRPRPRAPYTVFFVWEPSQIAKVTVIEHRGDTHPASSRTTIARQNGHNAEGNPAWLAKALVRAEVRFQIQDHQTGDPLEVKE